MARTAFSGQLYQLASKQQLGTGSYVAVNGPWDTFGVVWKSTKKDNGQFLNLIRGVKPDKTRRPVASF